MKNRYNFPILNALQFFIENPYEEIHLREFSRRLNISVNSAQRFLKVFLDENLVKDERKANLRYFRASLDSVVFRSIKKTYSLKQMEDSGLIDFLKKNFPTAVLFGSVAKGEDDSNSDIDLMCIGLNKKADLFPFQKKLNKEITLHFFTLAQWKQQKKENKAFYQEVISTGIVLVGEMPLLD